MRIVADSRGRLPLDARVLGAGGRTIVATTDASPNEWRQALAEAGAEAFVLPADDRGRVDLCALVRELGRRDVVSLLVEGGGVLHASMFAAGLVDKVHAIVAPKIVGGTMYPAVAGEGVAHMSEAISLRDVETCRLGDDVAFIGYVRGG
jgi:diaminohydroxyphosphoribosylaminopyrimidine deaminase/5-amino-6-(5-phosphoribosylamino)uracil reductase